MIPTSSPFITVDGFRKFTVADLAVMPSEVQSGTVLYELDNGRLITLPPHDVAHGATVTRFVAALLYQVQRRGLGNAYCGGVGIVLWRNPDRVVGADVAIVTTASLPVKVSEENYLVTIPELVVEVMDAFENVPAFDRKIADYLRAGVNVALVANPAKKTVSVYRPGQTTQVLTEKDVLTFEDVIPGFKMPVAEAFA